MRRIEIAYVLLLVGGAVPAAIAGAAGFGVLLGLGAVAWLTVKFATAPFHKESASYSRVFAAGSLLLAIAFAVLTAVGSAGDMRQAGSDGHLQAGFCPGREEGSSPHARPEEVQRRAACARDAACA